jgi:pyrimidine-nucleoside phosphorylase
LEQVTLELGAHMLVLGKKAQSLEEARNILKGLIASGAAAQKFKEMIAAQGGDERVVDEPSLLPTVSKFVRVAAERDGFVNAIEAEEIGVAAMMLGAGRATKDSVIDLGVGVVLHKEIGDPVHAGDTLSEMHVNGNDERLLAEVERKIREAYSIGKEPGITPPLIYAVVTQNGVERISQE